MKPLSDEKERLIAALRIARELHERPEMAEKYPSGTTITPVGCEDRTVYATVKVPHTPTCLEMERLDPRRRRHLHFGVRKRTKRKVYA